MDVEVPLHNGYLYLCKCSRRHPGLPFLGAELGRHRSQTLGELQVVQHLDNAGKVLYMERLKRKCKL